jgi:hypothetical protein
MRRREAGVKRLLLSLLSREQVSRQKPCERLHSHTRLIRVLEFRRIGAARGWDDAVEAEVGHHLAVVIGGVPEDDAVATRYGLVSGARLAGLSHAASAATAGHGASPFEQRALFVTGMPLGEQIARPRFIFSGSKRSEQVFSS